MKKMANNEVDAEKLIFAVEKREIIYNANIKDHSNKNIIDKLWEEISIEVNSPVSDCKRKWSSLRSSYTRQLREERNVPSGSGAKPKQKWYLSDAMGFLKDYVHQHRTTTSSLPDDDNSNEIESIDSPSSVASTITNSPVPPKKKKASEMVVGPMIDFLQSRTKNKTEDTANSLYFKSLLADCERLKPKNQRKFKKAMSDVMMQLQEEEEQEEIYGAQNVYQHPSATQPPYEQWRQL